MKRTPLVAQKRTVVGRKVNRLRKQGIIPGSVYGNNIKSLMLQMPLDSFVKVWNEAGETGLVDLTIDGEVKPVLVKHVQEHPVTSIALHVDFYQVNLKEKVTANVPVELNGVAPAVANSLGVLLSITDEVEVEALPTELPESIVVDISTLAEVGSTVKVSDLKVPQGVVILTEAETEVVKIGELVTKEAEAQAEADAQAAQAEATSAADGEKEAVEATQDNVASEAADSKKEETK